ncbi:hypothetical protein GCM10027436_83150 [Actinophytocola sediminis]
MVVCEGAVLLDVTGPVQVFTGAGGYRTRLTSLDGRPVRTDTGVVLGVDLALSDVDSPVDTVVVPGPTPGLLDGSSPALIAQLRRLGAGARRVASICTGAFLLAEAGLLAGTLLESCDAGVETVARRSGFGSDETLRRVFLQVLGITPTAYRQRFAHS